MRLPNWSVAQRITAAFVLMIVLVLVASGSGLFFFDNVTRGITTTGASLDQLSRAADLEVAWYQVVASTDYMLLTRQTSLIENRLTDELTAFNTQLEQVRAMPDLSGHLENRAILAALEGLAEDLNASVNEVFSQAQSGNWTRAQSTRHTELAALQRRFSENLTALRDHIQDDVTVILSETSEVQVLTRNALIGLSLAALVVGALASFLTARSVIRPIDRLVSTARAIQNGDFNARADEGGGQELATLGAAFNGMTAKLEESIETLKGNVSALERSNSERDRLIKELEGALLFKDQFLATMSHELRTPLNAMLGYSALILGEDELDEDVRYMVTRIEGNSTRLLNLINDILNISRINANRVEIVSRPIHLSAMVHAWYDDFKPQADERGLGFKLEIDPALPPSIIGDEERITQIIANLLQNALKFTTKGYIGLKVQRQGADKWTIAVADTGQGIPETWHHLIFDEFRQVDSGSKRKHGGAGLGLSIVKKLCLLMGGSVSVSSKLDVGSTFTVTLPLQTDAVLEPA